MEIVKRPWGTYEILFQARSYLAKRLIINPKASISLQWHKYRSETWVVCSGNGIAIVENKKKHISRHENIHVPRKAIHRLINRGKVPLVVIEIQNGSRLSEEDIIRLQDQYGRQ